MPGFNSPTEGYHIDAIRYTKKNVLLVLGN